MTPILKCGRAVAYLALACYCGTAPAQGSTEAGMSQSGATMAPAAYLHYLLAERYADNGIPYAALHEAAASLRTQRSNNPAAGLAFQLIEAQRQDTHLTFCCFTAKVITARFNGDGTRIMTVLDDGTLRVWDAVNGQPIFAPMQHGADILSAAWSNDGKWIVSSSRDGKVHLWDASTGKQAIAPFAVEQPLTHVAISPNGDYILGSEEGAVFLWNLRTGAVIKPRPYHDGINVLTFSNDGQSALIATNDDVADIVDAASAKRLQRLSLGNAAFHASFSEDSRLAVTASEDRTARVWDVATGKAHPETFTHLATVSDAEFSRDGRLLLTTSYDHTARVWDAHTGRPLTPPLQQSAPISDGNFSADNSLMYTRSREGVIQLWNVAAAEPAMLPIRNIGSHNDVAFSPAGPQLLLAIDNRVQMMDVPPGDPAPEWLADLADFEASRSALDTTPVQNRPAIERLRTTLLTANSTDRWSQFGRWYFATPQERTISPWSALPLKQYVESLIRTQTPLSLAEAKKAAIGHPDWLLRIAQAQSQTRPEQH